MGRKIEGKKHRGVKDPREQALRRFESIANKIDNPPPCIDDQPIPEKVLKIMEFKNRSVQVKKKQKEKKKSRRKLLSTLDFSSKEVELPGMTRPVKTPEIITQKRKESDLSFYHRVNQSYMQTVREAIFEDKFNMQVQRDPKTGVVMGVNRVKKTEADTIIEEARASKTQKKKKKGLSKYEKKKLKSIAKTQMKNEHETIKDFTDLKDDVKFGEVVHRPPELTVFPKRRNITGSQVQKPGRRDLLLKAMLDGGAVKKKPVADIQKTKNASPDSEARKKMLEKERIRVVELYRSMKNRKDLQL